MSINEWPLKTGFTVFFVVSSNCNDGNSFRCGFTHCIPKSFLCDGIADCAGREDEDNCQYPNTCQEWWKAGYHNSGVYDIRMSTISFIIYRGSYMSAHVL